MTREPGSLSVTILKRPPADTIRSLPTDPALPEPTQIVKTGCHVEKQSQTETDGLAMTNSEVAWIFFLPDSDSMAITGSDVLRFGGRDFHMQGPAVIEYGLDGEPVMVWCIAKWEAN